MKALGKVDLLGLNQYGQFGLNPLWGVVIGGGVTGISTMAARHSGNTSASKYAEGIGLGMGLATAGVMYAMKSTRHAAIGAALGAGFSAGLALLEKLLFGAVTVPKEVAGLAIPQINPLNGFGIPMARDLNGLGVPMIAERHPPAGAIPGVAGNQLAAPGMSAPPVSLLGSMSPQAAHLKGIGGPSVHGLSAAYGATLLGGGR